MIEVTGIDHVNLSVRDLERSIAFYRDTFGLLIKEDRRGASRPYVIMGRTAVAYLAIHENAAATAPTGPWLNHWGFVVGDIDRVLDKLAELGMKVRYTRDHPRGVVDYPGSRSVYVSDPDGHEIELVEAFGGGLH